MKQSYARWISALGPLLGLAFVVGLFSLSSEMRTFFLTGGNLKLILTQTVIVAIGALGMTLIIVSGGIDLSVGSVVALTSVVAARLAMSMSEPELTPAHLQGAPAVVESLRRADRPEVQWLAEKLSPGTRQQLAGSDPAGGVSALQESVARDLNRLITGPLLKREDSRLASVGWRDETLRLEQAAGTQRDRVDRYNRLVLEDLLPGSLPRLPGPARVLLVVGALTVAVGGLIGMINGATIAGLGMMPFIVTLGMMGVVRGSAKWMGDNQTVTPDYTPVVELMALRQPRELLPLPIGVWLAIALAVVMAVVLRQTVFGRHIFAIGSNEATARLCGIRVRTQKLLIYALAGLFFGLAGLLQFSRLTQGDPSVAVGLELDIIAAVVIGGASLSGGTGSIMGSMIGALMMAVLRNGTNQIGWPTYMQEIIIGIVIVLAVGLDKWRQARAASQAG